MASTYSAVTEEENCIGDDLLSVTSRVGRSHTEYEYK